MVFVLEQYLVLACTALIWARTFNPPPRPPPYHGHVPRLLPCSSQPTSVSASWRTGHSIPGLGHVGGDSSHLGSEFGGCCEAHSSLSHHHPHGNGHPGAPGPRKRQRPFDQNKLLTGLREQKEDLPPPRKRTRCGFQQVILTMVMAALLAAVLFCFVMSKLSFVVLTEAVRSKPGGLSVCLWRLPWRNATC